MKWRGRRTSSNVEDRRGAGAGGGFRIGRGRIGLPRMGRSRTGRGRRGGIGGIGGIGLILLIVVGLYLGVDPMTLIGLAAGSLGYGNGGGVAMAPQRTGPNTIDDERERFVAVVLGDTEEVWADRFAARGTRYDPPTLVLFSGITRSACGAANSASGPFYCPADRRIYLDTQFFDQMAERMGAGGDFAQAYVIAHEVAHHVQNVTGILPEVNRARAGASARQSNALSVRIELQADCFAGVWANRAQARFDMLEPGDIDEALNAASQIGDDTLMRAAGRAVVPDSFTHGTSEQRSRWFRTGWGSGDMDACDTFAAERL